MSNLDSFLSNFELYLKEWKHFSLVGKSTLNDIYNWHFCEAFSIMPLLNLDDNLVDFGAGGGVIGGVLQKYGFNIFLVDRSSNKLFFLKNVMHFDNVFSKLDCYLDKTVVVRGVTTILSLLRILFPCRKLILFKSLSYKQEIQEALKFYSFDYECFDRIGNASGKIIIIDTPQLR